MKNMEPAALVKQPEDVTENPYRKPLKEGRKENPLLSAAAEEVCVCLCENFLYNNDKSLTVYCFHDVHNVA